MSAIQTLDRTCLAKRTAQVPAREEAQREGVRRRREGPQSR